MSGGDQRYTGKYEQAGRVGGWLIDRFYAAVRELLARVPAPRVALEIGAGAGYSTERLRAMGLPGLVAAELEDSLARAASRRAGVPVLRSSVYALPHPDASADLVVMLEVLEHLDDPQAALAELARVSRGHVLLSTPREPLWRALNVARGKYLRALGNTPGHVQHWSTRGLAREVSSHFEVVDRRTPLPWTVLLLRRR